MILHNSFHERRVLNYSKTKASFTRWTLRDIFFKPERLNKKTGLMNDLMEGLTSQNGELWDDQFVSDVTNHLFEEKRGEGGLDLVALNIQRGRDHGIPGMYSGYCCNRRLH